LFRVGERGLCAGGSAVVCGVVVGPGPGLLAVLVALHIAFAIEFDGILGPPGPPLAGEALRARLLADVNVATSAIIVGFVLLSNVTRAESTRYGRLHADIALAKDIHRQLVPRIARTIGRFEFHGVSLASGVVGGDVVDVVGSRTGWTSFVADVSGHGVAAGLLMGMLEST